MNVSSYVCLRWWSVVLSYFGLILKFELKLEVAVIGLDMTTSSRLQVPAT